MTESTGTPTAVSPPPAAAAVGDAGDPASGVLSTLTPDTPVPPFDAAPDLALSLQTELLQMVDLGGPVLLVLMVLSILALTILLLKLWQFARVRLGQIGPTRAALARWHQGDAEGALAALVARPDPVARLTYLAMSGMQRPELDQAILREELARVAQEQLEALGSHLRGLEIIATLSPLLGLLGTVVGMIEAFRQLEAGGAQVDPAILSGGIWQALLTTAVGLTVAIPVVLAHGWLEQKVARCGHQMEDAVTQVFTRRLQPAAAPAAVATAETAALGEVAATIQAAPPAAPSGTR